MSTPEPKNAVDKALSLLFLIGDMARNRPVRVADLAERSGFSRPTVHRHLNSLQSFRLVDKAADGAGYRLGSAVMALSASLRGSLSIRERALPYLRALANETHCTVHLGARDGDRVIYVEKIENRHPIRLASAVGQAAGMHSSGLGKAILAFSEDSFIRDYAAAGLKRRTPNTIVTADALAQELERIRNRGFAVDDEENEAGVRCVAAPIFDHDNRVAASLSIAGTVQQIPRKAIAALSATAVRCARQISAEIGFLAAAPQ